MKQDCSGKYAYLIMAHEFSKVLLTLLKLVDNEQNDIYVHMDKKNKSEIPEEFKGFFSKENFFYFSEISVVWGTEGIALAQLALLKKATENGKYKHYHLLSGACLPIKKQSEIIKFFGENENKEFMHFGTEQYQKDIASRYLTYHFFEKQIGKMRDKPFWLQVETYSQAIQRRLHINRIKGCTWDGLYGGANWFSVTDGLARLWVKEYYKNRKYFKHTLLTEEFAFHTILMNSEYKDNLYMPGFLNDHIQCMRYIDWNRGNPYVWTGNDFDELIHANGCFARKFDEKRDSEIIDKLYEYLKE